MADTAASTSSTVVDSVKDGGGGLLLAKERPGRLLCDGDLRLIEVLRVRIG